MANSKSFGSMTRKEFLKKGAMGLVLIPGVALLSRCKSPSSPTPTTDSHVFTSDASPGHSHTITIQKTEVETPSGISRETAASSGHTHTFTVTADQLNTVKGGTAVSVNTAVTGTHFHTFVIQKWY
jgi:hypothetical protein